MTEHEDERVVSRRYRELPGEEPPRQLDEVILARARAAGDTVPAPLVPPTGRSRWYFPVAAAAILVLAVAVTWHIEREQPDAYVATAPEAVAPPKAAEAPALAKESRAPAPAVPAAQGERADVAESQPRIAASRMMRQEAATLATPAQWLERIARLRAEGRHEEADKALAEFRKRYPDFRISAEMLEKLERKTEK